MVISVLAESYWWLFRTPKQALEKYNCFHSILRGFRLVVNVWCLQIQQPLWWTTDAVDHQDSGNRDARGSSWWWMGARRQGELAGCMLSAGSCAGREEVGEVHTWDLHVRSVNTDIVNCRPGCERGAHNGVPSRRAGEVQRVASTIIDLFH